MSVQISFDLLVSLCIMLASSLFTVILHKKFNIMHSYHQISITILIGVIVGFILTSCVFSLLSVMTLLDVVWIR